MCKGPEMEANSEEARVAGATGNATVPVKENETPQDSQRRQDEQDPNHDASNGPHIEGSSVFLP